MAEFEDEVGKPKTFVEFDPNAKIKILLKHFKEVDEYPSIGPFIGVPIKETRPHFTEGFWPDLDPQDNL